MTPEISSQIDSPNIRRAVPAVCDILIGGGPAGAPAPHHPSFRVGQSPLPANLTLLERLGVAEKVRSARVAHIRAEPEPKTCGQEQNTQTGS
jgi:hypothetical protein